MEAAVGAVIGGSESETGSSEILHAAEQPCKNNYGKNIHLCKARENPCLDFGAELENKLVDYASNRAELGVLAVLVIQY